MSENTVEDAEILFRAPKRRKIQRKRPSDDDDSPAQPTSLIPNPEEPNISTESLVRLAKNPGTRKTGIAFSSTDRRPPTEPVSNEVALIPAVDTNSEDTSSAIPNDRFMKPTGRTGVVDDKHMIDYIDSKLAEMRSAGSLKPTTEAAAAQADEIGPRQQRPVNSHTRQTEATFASEEVEEVDVAKLRQPASRPMGPAKSRPERRRRGHVRDEKDIARDALIDQIMKESQVPIYDRSATEQGVEVEEDGEEHDDAVAEAFKAQFLEDLEARKRRKAPANPADADKMPSGPKLGGSRSQRARMMKMEEERKTGPGVNVKK